MMRVLIAFVAIIALAAFFIGLAAGEFRWMQLFVGCFWFVVALNWRRITEDVWKDQ